MKRIQWLLIVGIAAGGWLLMGCSADNSISPTPDLAAEWVSSYTGTIAFTFSNGQQGVTDKVTLNITAVDAKRIAFELQFTYLDPSGKNAFGNVAAIVAPSSPDLLDIETRIGNYRTIFDLAKADGKLTGIVYTSGIQGISRDWALEQHLTLDLAKK